MNVAEIEKLAEELAAKYNPDKVAPFPYVNAVKDNFELEVTFFLDPEATNTSGAILYQDKRFRILINSTKHENRQNFTLGHELGHYFLHRDILLKEIGLIDGDSYLDGSKVLWRLDDGKRDLIEREANHFAACLLMPSDLVRKAWEASEDVETLAQIFKVSTVAMSIRLTELGLVS